MLTDFTDSRVSSCGPIQRGDSHEMRTFSGWSSSMSRISASEPEASSLPRQMNRMRSANWSISCKMWLDTSTAFPCAAKVRNNSFNSLAADRVDAVKRFVEHEQIGVVHQRLAKLDALPHAFRVGTHRAIGALGHADRLEHRLGTPPRLGPGEPTQPGRHAHQLPPRQLIPRRVAERAQPDVILRPGRPGVPATHIDPAQAWLDLPGEQPQQRRFCPRRLARPGR